MWGDIPAKGWRIHPRQGPGLSAAGVNGFSGDPPGIATANLIGLKKNKTHLLSSNRLKRYNGLRRGGSNHENSKMRHPGMHASLVPSLFFRFNAGISPYELD
jgi:hypothetical protein